LSFIAALLDKTYLRSDQVYRNGTRVWAMVGSIGVGFHLEGKISHDQICSKILGHAAMLS